MSWRQGWCPKEGDMSVSTQGPASPSQDPQDKQQCPCWGNRCPLSLAISTTQIATSVETLNLPQMSLPKLTHLDKACTWGWAEAERVGASLEPRHRADPDGSATLKSCGFQEGSKPVLLSLVCTRPIAPERA